MAGRIIIRLLLLFSALVAISIVYSLLFCESDFKNYNPLLYRCSKISKKYDVIYLGESSNMTSSPADSSKAKISEMIAVFRPDLSVFTLDTFAVHSGIYAEWVRQIKIPPRYFIVTMNLRSFNSSWINSTMETPLQKSVRMKQTPFCAINRFLLSLNGFNDKSYAEREIDLKKGLKKQKVSVNNLPYKNAYEWDKAMATPIRNRVYRDREDSLRIVLACHYIKGYAFTLDESNPRIKDFDRIVSYCRDHNIKLVFNLLPENISYADSLVGKELGAIMRANRDFLVKRYSSPNSKVVDLLELLDSSYFINLDWTTEHYFDKGRMMIAKKLAESLN